MNGKWPILLPAEALEQLSDDEFWNYARELASLAPVDTDTYPEAYLRCALSSGDYLIPLTALHEVMLPSQDTHKGHLYTFLPSMPVWMVGVFAWRGETIAVIDLDAYFSTIVSGPGNDTGAESTLLIADCSGLAIGLLVPVVGLTTETASGAPVLDVPEILVDVVQQIRDVLTHHE